MHTTNVRSVFICVRTYSRFSFEFHSVSDAGTSSVGEVYATAARLFSRKGKYTSEESTRIM